MTETISSLEGVPVISADPFSLENMIDPHDLHEQMREAGPVVRLASYGIWGMARYEQVNAALKDWETFSSASGAGLSDFRKEKPCRAPSLLRKPEPPPPTYPHQSAPTLLAPHALMPLPP